MNLCIPVEQDAGPESPVCAHFGSAPLFLLVNTESGETTLCSDSCARLRGDPGARVEVLLGCDAVLLPPPT